jgi:uncharacterized membrane protein YhhN
VTGARIAALVFAAVAAATLAFYGAVALGLTTRASPLIWCTKPLVVPALLAWLALSVRGVALDDVRKRAVFLALVFSTLGDIFLIPRSPRAGLLGVASFGVAHLCYVAAFARATHFRSAARAPEAWGGLLAIAMFAWLLRGLIGPGLKPELVLPFDIYMALVLATTASAVARFVARGDRASSSILAGAALFLESDGLIAVRVSGLHVPLADLAVMGSYIAAQLLIARGVALSRAAPS